MRTHRAGRSAAALLLSALAALTVALPAQGAAPEPAGGTAAVTAADLRRADTTMLDRRWHPAAARTRYQYWLDEAAGRYTVSFHVKDRAVGEALRARLGRLVDVGYGGGEAAAAPAEPGVLAGPSRFNDASPHFGGSELLPPDPETERRCTSGFSVIGPGGVQSSLTAGHCAGPGGFNAYESGVHFYGFTSVSLQDEDRDMALLTDPIQSYAPFIHVDPGTITQRRVTGVNDPVFNQSVCVSGSVTRAKCSARVTGLSNGTSCDEFLCTSGLFVATRPGVRLAQEGDSGAPIYAQGAGSTAVALGMLVAVTEDGFTILGHRSTQLEVELGVDIRTG